MRASMVVAAAFAAGLGASAGHASEADAAAGEEIYQGSCRSCHGPEAQGLASYPKLADKSESYLTGRLERYREGERIGPNSMLMIPHAQPLSDEDIVNIASYITGAFGE